MYYYYYISCVLLFVSVTLKPKNSKNKCTCNCNVISSLLCVLQPAATGIKMFEGRQKLTAWRDRVKKEVGENLFDEAHEQLMNLGSVMRKLDSEGKMERLKSKYRKIFS